MESEIATIYRITVKSIKLKNGLSLDYLETLMLSGNRIPTHIGEILLEEFLKSSGIKRSSTCVRQ